jgi:small subunit ribosomal protein S1
MQSPDDDSAEDFSALLGASLESSEKPFAPGDRVRAELLAVGAEDSPVAIGPGREGLLATAELRDAAGQNAFKAGDQLELFVTSVRGTQVRLSRNPTDKNLAEDLKQAFDLKRPIEGRVVELCKGGFRVSVKGKSAFCPISQIDLKRTETGAEFVGKTFAFSITEFGEGGRNVVLSRRKLLEEEQARAAAAFLAANPDGSIVTGTVVRLEKFGAFVQLVPGVEGLLHVSEIAWSRIADPSEILKAGQSVELKLLKRETVEGRLKISLSLKQASERPESAPKPAVADPWAKYAAGQVLEGKITRKEPYGLFIQLEPGVVGLLHQSKTSDSPDFNFDRQKVGETISVQIAEVKISDRRISLELPRDPDADEWQSRQQQDDASTSLSPLAEQLKAALDKKKR